MTASDFETWLLSAAAPRLRMLGYEYDGRLRLGEELFGFRKALGDDVHAVVQFQRHRLPDDEFTINLIRAKSAEVAPHFYDGDPAARGARLGHVLWFVCGRRVYAQPDQWWQPNDLPGLLEELERCGLPWLEDAVAVKPWEMPAHRGREFAEAVQAGVAADFAAEGYRFEVQTLAGGMPYPYLVRAAPDGAFELIEFQIVYGLDPQSFTFDVRLQRKATADPLDYGGAYSAWAGASLGLLRWRDTHSTGEGYALADVADVLWRYASRAELDEALRDAAAQIRRLALPWLAAAGQSTVLQ